ncbi:DNA alkylation repair protein [Thauera sp. SDU_THAU2]|uniref:DNA alkylation repair protein n=1 Tax=Thauera sp. SDU_THAU2 TaxID=3136633 RepID=UPI00311E8B69
MVGQAADAAPALKEIFDEQCIQHFADEAGQVSSAFDRQSFLACFGDLDRLSLMARVKRVAEGLHVALPGDFRSNVATLRELAPRLNNRFITLVLPEYVAFYGTDDFETSMDALKFFTNFGSSEFAVRHFLRRDLPRTLKVMEAWARDDNEHVRRLASEGSRPRLPWSFRIKPLMLDPSPLVPILDALKDDPSLYVRRSVANNLNDIAKDNPAWALDRIERWPLGDAGTAWIAKHALRSLIKKGEPRALAVIGAGGEPQVKLTDLGLSPPVIRLGQSIELEFVLSSTTNETQRLVVDYAIHYVKKSGSVAPKVFKLKVLELAGNAVERVRKRQTIANFTTRVHYPGHHAMEILVNGQVLGRTSFELLPG